MKMFHSNGTLCEDPNCDWHNSSHNRPITTPVRKSDCWMAVDLDGTLAVSGTKVYNGPIGEPILDMVYRVKDWIAQDIEVRIFTARVSPLDKNGYPQPPEGLKEIRQRIGDWCEKHLGKRLDIVCSKDHNIIMLWDDRAVQVVRDTGERVGGKSLYE